VDASVIKAKQYQPNKDKNGEFTRNPEAKSNVKVRINVNEDELISSMDYTPGTGHDSNCFSTLLDCDHSAVYDKRLNRLQSATR